MKNKFVRKYTIFIVSEGFSTSDNIVTYLDKEEHWVMWIFSPHIEKVNRSLKYQDYAIIIQTIH